MSTAQEGYTASISVNGTQIALLSEVGFTAKRDGVRWVPMGSVDATDVLLGAVNYDLTAKHGYVSNNYLNFLRGGSVLSGSLIPCTGGGTISCSMVCTDIGIQGMKQASADPVFEDLTFIMYAVTHT